MKSDLLRTALYEAHRRRGAQFIDFAGWAMPLSYTTILGEHMQVRRHAGLFDISHLGRFLLEGAGAVETMQRLVAGDLSRLQVGAAKYTLLLTPWGGIRDDLLVYRPGTGLLLVVNAANAVTDREWIRQNLAPATHLDDLTDHTSLLALQGPEAAQALATLTPLHLDLLRPFSLALTRVAGVEATVMRTGYTGEDGFEIMVTNDNAVALWEALLDPLSARVAPCGLGARDTLRLEAGFLLYGQDLTRDTSPFEARLDRLVDTDRPDFVGRVALQEAKASGPRRLLVGLTTAERVIPRQGDTLANDVEVVGEVTSGTYSPVLGHPIALGYAMPPYAQAGCRLTVVGRRRRVEADVVRLPFYRRGTTPLPASEGEAGGA